jgi:phosphotriesterase-related protein
MAEIVRTVTGAVDPGWLGRTMAHEHVISDLTFRWQPSDDPRFGGPVRLSNLQHVRRAQWASRDNLRLGDPRTAVAELVAFGRAGGGTIVELSNATMGRDVRALAAISRARGVLIVAGTGNYVAGAIQASVAIQDPAAIAEDLIRDLTTGADGTTIRCGVIGEVAAGSFPMEPVERRSLQAAAIASARTGAAIVAHPAPGTASATEVLDVLLDGGADPARVCVAHIDERLRDDVGAVRELVARGCTIGYDTFGREAYYQPRDRQHPTDTQRIETLLRLLDAGLEDRIVLSQDLCMRIDLGAFGGPGYDHILVTIVPRLRSAGVPGSTVDALLVTNPARLLSMRS